MIRTLRARCRFSCWACRGGAWRLAKWIVVIGGLCGGSSPGTASDATELTGHPTDMIDSMIAEAWQAAAVEPSGLCDDATFVRRLSLDLIGRVPTASERAAFLEDARPDKRERLIEQLLESPAYARHMTDVFDALLIGRRPPAVERTGRRRGGDQGAARRAESGWREYLEESFATNRPWNRMARDIVLARATDDTDVRAGWFLYQRRDSHQDIAEAVAPAFFGIRIECAQCHDHPLASEIEQGHYWGLVAFFSRSKNRQTDQGLRVGETADGGTKQYTDLAGDSHETRLTFFASGVVDEPIASSSSDVAVDSTTDDAATEAGEKVPDEPDDSGEYVTSIPSEPPVPKFSRRQQFADRILADHPLLARSLVNRMWALLVGQGFVHPHDRMDSTHPASHPELLDALAEELRASNYDVKRLVRHIVLSRAYQLDSRPVDAQALPEHFAYGLTKLLPAESLLRSMFVVLRGDDAEPDAELLTVFRDVFPDVLPEEPISNLSQALLLTNHGQLNRLFDVATSPVLAQLAELPTVEAQVDRAFQVALGRDAAADERGATVAFVQTHAEPNRGLAQLMWALLTSTEFRVNH